VIGRSHHAEVARAVEGNLEWCAAVCRAHGIGGHRTGHFWVAEGASPARYPTAISVVPGGMASELKPHVMASGASVKDSFGDTDLGSAGFHRLFDAHWLSFEATPEAVAPDLDWSVADTPEQLTAWMLASESGDVVPAGLLRSEGFHALLARRQGRVVAGATAFQHRGAVGISNLFSLHLDRDEAWAGTARHLRALTGADAVVSYAHGPDLEAAEAAGFGRLGPLTVWIRP